MNFETINYLDVIGLTNYGVYLVKPESGTCAIPKAFTVKGRFVDVERILSENNLNGASIYVQVQGGMKRGDRFIRTVEWLYLDFDNVDCLPILPFPPHLIVRTQSGFHVYWRIDRTNRLGLWRAVIREMRSSLCACPSVGAVGQMLRVPGFLHHKHDPFLVTIHAWDPNRPNYRLDDFAERYDICVADDVEEGEFDPAPALRNLRCEFIREAQREMFPIFMHELRRQVDRIEKAWKGTRHTTVRNAAFCLGHYVHLGLDAERTYRKLLKAVERRGWVDRDLTVKALRPVILSGLRRGYQDGPPTLKPENAARLEHVDARDAYRLQLIAMLPALPDRVTTRQVLKFLGGRSPLWSTDKQESHQIAKVLLEHGFKRRDTRLKGQTVYIRVRPVGVGSTESLEKP